MARDGLDNPFLQAPCANLEITAGEQQIFWALAICLEDGIHVAGLCSPGGEFVQPGTDPVSHSGTRAGRDKTNDLIYGSCYVALVSIIR